MALNAYKFNVNATDHKYQTTWFYSWSNFEAVKVLIHDATTMMQNILINMLYTMKQLCFE